MWRLAAPGCVCGALFRTYKRSPRVEFPRATIGCRFRVITAQRQNQSRRTPRMALLQSWEAAWSPCRECSLYEWAVKSLLGPCGACPQGLLPSRADGRHVDPFYMCRSCNNGASFETVCRAGFVFRPVAEDFSTVSWSVHHTGAGIVVELPLDNDVERDAVVHGHFGGVQVGVVVVVAATAAAVRPVAGTPG